MILFTYRLRSGGTPGVRQIVRKGEKAFDQTTKIMRKGPFPIAEEILSTLETFKNQDVILYVAPGAVVRPPLSLLGSVYDVAARVKSIGERPVGARPFSGVGKVLLDTLAFRNSPIAIRTLRRWADRLAASTVDPSVALAIALRETKAALLHLPESYCWRESEDRPGRLTEVVGIDHSGGLPEPVNIPDTPRLPVVPAPYTSREPGVFYSSHLRDYSGYAKASRNILFRISNSIRVKVDQSDLEREPIQVDADVNRRIDAYMQTLIPDRAPLFRFYTPKYESRKSYRICSTMMESETLSPEFARLLNENYQEVIVPTHWNKQVFGNGGVKIPIEVIPLGIDPLVYKPGKKTKRPKANLLTTAQAGTIECPSGYAFVAVFQPTFRKGADHLVAAFDRAFSKHPDDASLVLVTSVHAKLEQYGCAPFSRLRRGVARSAKSRIYHLTGTWSEWEMTDLYRSFDCYVASSAGEGWDLPMTEAAACGLPVIATRCSSHAELLAGTRAWMYGPDGYTVVPGSGQVSRFYEGQKFATFGADAVDRLSDMLIDAVTMLKKSSEGRVVLIDHTWDAAANLVSKKLIQVQEGIR